MTEKVFCGASHMGVQKSSRLFKSEQHSAGTQPGAVAAELQESLGVRQPFSRAHAVRARQKALSPVEESSGPPCPDWHRECDSSPWVIWGDM